MTDKVARIIEFDNFLRILHQYTSVFGGLDLRLSLEKRVSCLATTSTSHVDLFKTMNELVHFTMVYSTQINTHFNEFEKMCTQVKQMKVETLAYLVS